MPAMFSSGYCVKVPSWHKEEELLENAPKTVTESLERAGQNWDAELQPVFGADLVEIPFAKLIRRMDNGVPLNVVGPNTSILQNRDAFDVLTPFLEKNEIVLETAGCLDEGRIVWALAKINRPNFVVVKNDEIEKYLLITNFHGKFSAKILFTGVRVVCYNTLSMALNQGKKGKNLVMKIRHTSDVKQKYQEAATTINVVNQNFDKNCEVFAELAKHSVKEGDAKKYFKEVFSLEDNDDKMPKQSRRLLDNLLAKYESEQAIVGELLENHRNAVEISNEAQEIVGKRLLENMENGIGMDIPGVRGSAWGMYNAVTQLLTHEKGRTSDNRQQSLWYGQSAKVNEKALKLAMEYSGVSQNQAV